LKEEEEVSEEPILDFATSIQRVKDYGWYWGPLPSEVAEKILSNEPDGSFIVRDSSDDHYIFSLTFKLNNCVRHVRIDHDQGNFSFGSCTKFKSQTIVEFIENAVEHSRSGRYLFFLHRRPVIGPVRVQLLHPVSRFKQVQSLQHICRFAIHKVVRRDLIPSLPLPRRMIDYLNTPHYYSEHLIDVEDTSNEQVPQVPPRNPTPAIRRDYQEEEVQALVVPNVPLNNYVVLNNTNPRQS
jgi:suppressor of cytokine signaling 7